MPEPQYPEQGEYALATVKKVMPYGAFLALDEYGGSEAFLHISEVSSGWVRNVREYVKEGQKTVVLVTRVDLGKRQVDCSLKRVSEADRKRKLESYKREKRAEKLLDRVAHKLKKTLPLAMKEVGQAILKDYGALFDAFEDLALNDNLRTKVPKPWHDALAEVAKAEIKPKRVNIRAKLTLRFYGGNGVAALKETLAGVTKAGTAPQTPLKVHYLGAGQYLLDVESGDYKSAEKALARAQAYAEEAARKLDGESLYERERKE
jgi:translation initiation factor 2 subunit 1